MIFGSIPHEALQAYLRPEGSSASIFLYKFFRNHQHNVSVIVDPGFIASPCYGTAGLNAGLSPASCSADWGVYTHPVGRQYHLLSLRNY